MNCKLSAFYPIFHKLAIVKLPMERAFNMIAVIGPTASEKTLLAAHLAFRLNGEVISADSRQVYRQMNIGTGKDYSDYIVGDVRVPCHLIDIADPGYKYSVYEYQRDFHKVFQMLLQQGKLPVLCGGSGMYIEAAIRGYELREVPVNEELRNQLSQKTHDELIDFLRMMKKSHNTSDDDTRDRTLRAIEIETFNRQNTGQPLQMPRINPLYVGVRFESSREKERITARLLHRLKHGLVEEVKKLLDTGIAAENLIYYGLEYRYITQYLHGTIPYGEMVDLLKTAIHQFAKRQRTWFRRMERQGYVIHWLDGEMPLEIKIESVLHLLDNRSVSPRIT
jgi:tRNA dimethylallyltransferase